MKNPIRKRFIALLTAAALMPVAANAQDFVSDGIDTGGAMVKRLIEIIENEKKFYGGIDVGVTQWNNLCEEQAERLRLAVARDPRLTGVNSVTCNNKAPFARFLVGMNVNDWLAFEGSAVTHEQFETTGVMAITQQNRQGTVTRKAALDYYAFDLAVIGKYRINDVYTVDARAGALAWSTDSTATVSNSLGLAPVAEPVTNFRRKNEDGTSFIYGAGITAEMSEDYRLRAHWSRTDGKFEVHSFGIGLSYHF